VARQKTYRDQKHYVTQDENPAAHQSGFVCVRSSPANLAGPFASSGGWLLLLCLRYGGNRRMAGLIERGNVQSFFDGLRSLKRDG
jgi:hypothetical protein